MTGDGDGAAEQIETMFAGTLNLFYRSVQSLVGQKFSVDESDAWMGTVGKITTHALSMLYLANGTKGRLSDIPFNFGDSASVSVLARALVEAYATLYYLFLDVAISEDERIFRIAYHQMRGLLLRQSVQAPEFDAKRKQEREHIDRLLQKIQSTQTYGKLKPKRASQIEKGTTDHMTKTDMIINAGFSELWAKFIYNVLSDAAHAGYLGALQFGQAQTSVDQRRGMGIGLQTGAMTLGLAVHSLSARFPAVANLVNLSTEDQGLVWLMRTTATNDSLFTMPNTT